MAQLAAHARPPVRACGRGRFANLSKTATRPAAAPAAMLAHELGIGSLLQSLLVLLNRQAHVPTMSERNSPPGPTSAPGPPAAPNAPKQHYNEQPNHQPRHEPSHQAHSHAQINRPTTQPAQRGREH
ncbi:hypothetical protein BASA81_003221 [Batrachochytrium salamandrivorans]|nr:hypothetical protein BASA81_003221 [Batrachochytrium salamandrivorans]